MADFNDPHQPDLIAEPRAEYHAHETQIDREAYRSRLKLLLQDPEFRKIEGFPIGTDEAIDGYLPCRSSRGPTANNTKVEICRH